jgi:hypothetical protein
MIGVGGVAGLHDHELRAFPYGIPTSPSDIPSAHPDHRHGESLAVTDPKRGRDKYLMTSRDHWMLLI